MRLKSSIFVVKMVSTRLKSTIFGDKFVTKIQIRTFYALNWSPRDDFQPLFRPGRRRNPNPVEGMARGTVINGSVTI
jgi:hypothetical protein